MAEPRRQVRHPRRGPQQNLPAGRYEAVRAALVEHLRTAGPDGATFDVLDEHVRGRMPPGLFPRGGSARWHAKAVRLDLEAGGTVERVPGSRPLRLAATD